MDNQLLHTPDGVRDLYEAECEAKLLLQDRIHSVFKSYGYRDIETPSYEFFDIFNKERGSVASRNMFKFFDRDNNTMVLRPDITPCIARCAAKYYSQIEGPVRLCYVGKVFMNNIGLKGKLSEFTQAGCELISGKTTTDAANTIVQDAEMIALLIRSILSSGLKEFQVEIGHVGFFDGICKQAGLSEDACTELRTIIRNKNLFLIDEFMKKNAVDESFRDTFYALPQTFGGVEILDIARRMTDNEEALSAITHLEKIYALLEEYRVTEYITFDMGVMSELNYYTGVIFKAYTFDVGEPVANGGRYDRLVLQFGADKASIGFSVNVDLLAQALHRQDIEIPLPDKGVLIVHHGNMKDAIALANYYRNANIMATIVSETEEAALDTAEFDKVVKAEAGAAERS